MITYIIEDSTLKADLLLKFLEVNFSSLEICLKASYQSGLKAIEAVTPELVILDMTLPNFDRVPNAREGRIRPLGGYDLMRKIKLRKVPTKVIVVTQLESYGDGDEEVSFEEMESRCAREFPQFYVGSVYFDQREAAWQDNLKKLIGRLGIC